MLDTHTVENKETAQVVSETDNTSTRDARVDCDTRGTRPAVASAPPSPDYGMDIHAVCKMFPLMSDDDLEKFAQDIKTHGLIEPVVRHESKLVDGRHRLLACHMAGIEPRFVEWREKYDGPMTVSQWIFSTNAKRRHMTATQLAAAHLAIKGWEEHEEVRLRAMNGRRQGGVTAGRGRSKADSMLANPPVSNTSEAAPEGVMEAKVVTGPKKAHSEGIRSKLSEEFDISKHKAQQLLDVERKSPDLLAQVSQGSIPLPQAVKMARASTSHKMTSSTKEPQIKNTFSKKSARAAKEARPLERLITRAVHAVEKILKLVPKDRQEKFRMEVAKAVRNLA